MYAKIVESEVAMARAKLLLQEIETYAQNIGDTVRDPLIILDRELRVKSANRSFYKTFHVVAEETEGCYLHELGRGQWNIPELLSLLREIVPTKGQFDGFEVADDFPKIGSRTMLLNARKLYRPGNRTVLIVLAIEDITERSQAEAELAAIHFRDRQIALTLQRSLLFLPGEDVFPGLEIGTGYETMSHETFVGGDFWDMFAFDSGAVALVTGDVTGHGLMAALFTAEFKYTVRGYLREHEQPAVVLEKMNAYLCQTTRLHREGLNQEGGEHQVCLTIAVINASTGEGIVATAGMDAPLLVRADGQTEELNVLGMLLGVDPLEKYESIAFQLARGDAILMVTDGITEARRGNDFLGLDGLARLVADLEPEQSVQLMAQAIVTGAREHAGGNFRDDICLVLARRL